MTVPDDIKMVATKMVASIIKVGKDEAIKSFSQGEYSVTYSDFSRLMNQDVGIKSVLDWYKKKPKITGYTMTRI
jgi:hypothetical protein